MTASSSPKRTRYVVARVVDVVAGKPQCVKAGGREIALFNVAGQFHALANKCPHESGPLSRGTVVGLSKADVPGEYRLERAGEFVRCPWHGWEFDIKTGQSYCDPTSTRVRTFEAKIEPGVDLVKGPYIAETFPVTVDGDYVVVEI